jgi:ribosomal protein S18 acetylase RimI-like enzyme
MANPTNSREAAVDLQDEHRSIATLASVAVHPDHQGKGYGRKLIQAALEKCRELKAQDAFICTSAVNNDAFNGLLQRMGFKLTRAYEVDGGERVTNEFRMELDTPRAGDAALAEVRR